VFKKKSAQTPKTIIDTGKKCRGQCVWVSGCENELIGRGTIFPHFPGRHLLKPLPAWNPS
jgi:hypothetical protein